MRHLFGTDGIRGEAGVPPLDPETVSRVGAALGASLRAEGRAEPPVVVVGGDTRESTDGIVAALTGGLAAQRVRVAFAGVVPTPAVAWLVGALGADAGVSVSASHNPWRDNGIKLFSRDGRKLPDAVEAGIEERIGTSAGAAPRAPSPDPSLPLPLRRPSGRHAPPPARGADGDRSTRRTARRSRSRLSLSGPPAPGSRRSPPRLTDGTSTRGAARSIPRRWPGRPWPGGPDLGLALDGDADRIVLADGAGRLLDGDDVLYLWTHELIREGRKPPVVVGTVMSNYGLERALAALGVGAAPRARRRPLRRRADGAERLPSRGRAVRPSHPVGPDDDGRRDADGTPSRRARRRFGAAARRPAALRPPAPAPPERPGREAGPVRAGTGLRRRADARGEPPRRARAGFSSAIREPSRFSAIMVEGEDAALVEQLADHLAARAREALGGA